MSLLRRAVHAGQWQRKRGFACWQLSPITKLLAASVNGCIQYRLIVEDPAGFEGIDDLFNGRDQENDEVRDALKTAGILGADGRATPMITSVRDVGDCLDHDCQCKKYRCYADCPKCHPWLAAETDCASCGCPVHYHGETSQQSCRVCTCAKFEAGRATP